jgi:hypothetical protein
MDDGALEVHWTGGVPWSGGFSGLVSPGTGWFSNLSVHGPVDIGTGWIKVGPQGTITGTGTHVVRACCNGNGASEGPEWPLQERERKGKKKKRRKIRMTVVWMLNLSTKCRANELHFSLWPIRILFTDLIDLSFVQVGYLCGQFSPSSEALCFLLLLFFCERRAS